LRYVARGEITMGNNERSLSGGEKGGSLKAERLKLKIAR
jgi:hypothetical protein